MSTSDRPRALCFVAMPFGTKPRPAGGTVDFDAVYQTVIRPAIDDAGLQPLRADEEQVGGIIHKPMFERLILSEFAVADLTTANANVFYELGIRHAVRPFTTVTLMAADARLPFDLNPVRSIPYELTGSVPADPEATRRALTDALVAAREHSSKDSPVFQLLEGFGEPDIERLRTDVFRERVDYSARIKDELARARESDDPAAAIDAIRKDLGSDDIEAGVAVDLFLTYRDAKEYEAMVAFYDDLPDVLRRTPIVREQLGFALNRLGRRGEAERVLRELIDERGPSSETLGLLGRVYKDQWQDACAAGNTFEADGHLEKAITAYVEGFEADWRDAYPGINAVTLMELAEPPDPRRTAIAPVVAYSAERRIAAGSADYWDHATLFEAAVLADQREQAARALRSALAAKRAEWEAESTLNNFRLIVEKRRERGDDRDWYDELDRALATAAGHS